MNDLRIVLLVVGVAAVAVLYFWEASRERRQQRRRTLMAGPGADVLSVRVRDPGDGDDAGALADLGVSIARERMPAAADPPSATATDPARIISLHVVSTGAPFAGPDIFAAAGDAGLHHGPMRIFHRYDAGGMEYEKPLFSLASMREPGYLDPDGDFTTTGLSLFMCPPVPAGEHLVFDLMLRTAERLAGTLGGELRASDHGRLDAGRLAALRARLSA